MTDLREQMKADPFFATAESFKPERRRTALLLHAKDDLPEVRVKVFELLRSLGSAVRFHAVVCDKLAVQKEEEARRAADPTYRYSPDHLYDRLTRSLFAKFHQVADRYQLCIAKRGNKNRNAALLQALEHAERDFENTFGFSRGGVAAWSLTVSNPEATVCLQAVDYYLWALQRFYEPQVHPVTAEVTPKDSADKLFTVRPIEPQKPNPSASTKTCYLLPVADVFTKKKRSQVMAAIRSRGNKDTELKLVAMLRTAGITGWRRHQPLAGRPDFVFRRGRLAVFVDGCFWHGCRYHCRMPQGNREYWQGKIARNRTRDRLTTRLLRSRGWRVLRIWGHALAAPETVIARITSELSAGLKEYKLAPTHK